MVHTIRLISLDMVCGSNCTTYHFKDSVVLTAQPITLDIVCHYVVSIVQRITLEIIHGSNYTLVTSKPLLN